jgi:hypothetical protein
MTSHGFTQLFASMTSIYGLLIELRICRIGWFKDCLNNMMDLEKSKKNVIGEILDTLGMPDLKQATPNAAFIQKGVLRRESFTKWIPERYLAALRDQQGLNTYLKIFQYIRQIEAGAI